MGINHLQTFSLFRSFRLFGHSRFSVVPAFRSFRLSGRFGLTVVTAVRSFMLFLSRSDHCKQKKFYKGKHIELSGSWFDYAVLGDRRFWSATPDDDHRSGRHYLSHQVQQDLNRSRPIKPHLIYYLPVCTMAVPLIMVGDLAFFSDLRNGTAWKIASDKRVKGKAGNIIM